MSSSADRVQAARILVRTEQGAFAGRALGAGAGPGVRARVLGTLRWLRALDAVLAPVLRRPLDRLDAGVRATLRLGLLEATEMGVPAAVATDGAVRLVRRLGLASAAGLVNAVLRRAIEAWPQVMVSSAADVRYSHPEWLCQRWRDRFGDHLALEIMAVDQQPAPVWAWFAADDRRQEAVARGLELEPHPWCPDAWRAADDVGGLLAVVGQGAAYVQDPTSQLVARLAAALRPSAARIVEMCAAPGGKAALLVRLARPPLLVAMDRSLPRLRLARAALAQVGGGVAVAADGGRPPLGAAIFDLVLLDAPCSGTGTLRRHPELRWRLDPSAIDALAAVQRRLLAAAFELAAAGGIVVYSTCSIEAEENENHFDPPPPGWRLEDLDPLLPAGAPSITTCSGGVLIPPHADGDGFTIHALRRH